MPRPKLVTAPTMNRTHAILMLAAVGYLPLASTLAQEDVEVPLPCVILLQPAPAPTLDTAPLSEERSIEIEELIDQLRGIVKTDLSWRWTGPFDDAAFLPVDEERIRRVSRGDISEPIRRLIEIGPDALPQLLAGLEDDRQTEVVQQASATPYGRRSGMAFDEILHGNPVNPTESRVLALGRFPYTDSVRPDPGFLVANELEAYRVSVGDVCFEVIGQIVGRDFQCLFRDHVKTADVLVCSPVHRVAMRDRVRQIWASGNPRQKVLESLILDFYTRENPLAWDCTSGDRFQIEAAKRLLYYYPDHAVPMIVDRIRSLRGTNETLEDYAHNGVAPDRFVAAVGWSDRSGIREALVELLARTEYEELRRAIQKSIE